MTTPIEGGNREITGSGESLSPKNQSPKSSPLKEGRIDPTKVAASVKGVKPAITATVRFPTEPHHPPSIPVDQVKAQSLMGKLSVMADKCEKFHKDNILPALDANGSKEEYAEHWEPIRSFVLDEMGKDFDSLPLDFRLNFAKTTHDMGYWDAGQSAKVDNPTNPLMGASIVDPDTGEEATSEKMKDFLTDKGLETYNSRYEGKSFRLRVSDIKEEQRAEFFNIFVNQDGNKKDTSKMNLNDDRADVINANARSYEGLIAHADSFEDPSARLEQIYQNQRQAVCCASTLLLAKEKDPDSVDMDRDTAVLWRYTGHWESSPEDAWNNQELVRTPYEQLSEDQKEKDRPVWQAIQTELQRR